MTTNKWNVKNSIKDFREDYKEEILKWLKLVQSKNYTKSQNIKLSPREIFLQNNPLSKHLKEYLEEIYNSGYGFKLIARALGISYTNIRILFLQYLKIETRKGTSIVTDKLKEFRSERIKGDKGPWYNWPELKPHLAESNSRGIQGYYKIKSGKYIWLRSTWEYIFIKWLEVNNHEFIYEPGSFKLLNGETYRPDLRVKSKGKFYYIEIKGRPYSDRLYKVDMFKKEYGEDVIVIDNVDKFRTQPYTKEIKEWKAIRLSREKLKSLQ